MRAAQVVCIGAGTPNRLCKLADEGALRLGRLRHVVLDLQLDAKQRCGPCLMSVSVGAARDWPEELLPLNRRSLAHAPSAPPPRPNAAP